VEASRILHVRSVAVLCLTFAILGCWQAAPPFLVMATTTSLANSGLLDPLLERWHGAGGMEVRPVLVGSGRALRMLELGQADLVISHAPDAEREYLARHERWHYRKIMFNEFVLVGPATDPAGVRSATTVEQAFERMASNPVRFVSRGDRSGTHERELALWGIARTSMKPDRLVTSGAGMAATLRQTAELGAYTLSDLATYEQLKDGLSPLVIVWSGDSRLLNTYAVIANREAANADAAMRLATWLAEGDGRTFIKRYRIPNSTQPPFRVWRQGAPNDTPAAMPW
jgi:tungstate transport system substrate-binding protein